MAEIAELNSIFNRVIQLARFLLEDSGYVFSVNLDLLKRSFVIQVVDKAKKSEAERLPLSFRTSVRPVGKSPFATTVPVKVAEAMLLEPGDMILWLMIDSGAYVAKAERKSNAMRKRKASPEPIG